jgi:hypothetical protein
MFQISICLLEYGEMDSMVSQRNSKPQIRKPRQIQKTEEKTIKTAEKETANKKKKRFKQLKKGGVGATVAT